MRKEVAIQDKIFEVFLFTLIYTILRGKNSLQLITCLKHQFYFFPTGNDSK